MVNGRPPTCKMQEARMGNYVYLHVYSHLEWPYTEVHTQCHCVEQ